MTPETPAVPLTLEGASVLHQMMRFRWPAWRALSVKRRGAILEQAAPALATWERPDGGRQSAVYSLLGHKGDLLFLHFRRSFEELNQAQLELARLRLGDYLEPVTSYLSVVELGLYDSTAKVYGELAAKGVEPHSGEWNQEIEAVLARQRQAMPPRSSAGCSRRGEARLAPRAGHAWPLRRLLPVRRAGTQVRVETRVRSGQ